MLLLTKPISAKKLNIDAMRKIIEDEVKSIADDIEADFKKTTATWDHKPQFDKEVQIGPGEIAILVGTDDEIYNYVDQGTRPHKIKPKKPGGVLAFQSIYTAKTVPKIVDSGSGGSSGSTVFTTGVNHPGTKARKFSEAIAEDWEPEFKKRMEMAFSKASKVSGWSVGA